jgi:hypothetical protein
MHPVEQRIVFGDLARHFVNWQEVSEPLEGLEQQEKGNAERRTGICGMRQFDLFGGWSEGGVEFCFRPGTFQTGVGRIMNARFAGILHQGLGLG